MISLEQQQNERFAEWEASHGFFFASSLLRLLSWEGLQAFFGQTFSRLDDPTVMDAMDDSYEAIMASLAVNQIGQHNQSLILRSQIAAEMKQILADDDEADARAGTATKWAATMVLEHLNAYHPTVMAEWVIRSALDDMTLIAAIGCTYPEAGLAKPQWAAFVVQRCHLWSMGVPVEVQNKDVVTFV